MEISEATHERVALLLLMSCTSQGLFSPAHGAKCHWEQFISFLLCVHSAIVILAMDIYLAFRLWTCLLDLELGFCFGDLCSDCGLVFGLRGLYGLALCFQMGELDSLSFALVPV